MYWRVVGLRPAPELTLSTQQGPRLAYAVPVFAGLMVTIWLQLIQRRIACESERGAELIEFALVLPLLLLIILGIVDFGFMFQRFEVVTNAAREGARIAVLPGYATADVEARVQNYLTTGGVPPPRARTRRCRSPDVTIATGGRAGADGQAGAGHLRQPLPLPRADRRLVRRNVHDRDPHAAWRSCGTRS